MQDLIHCVTVVYLLLMHVTRSCPENNSCMEKKCSPLKSLFTITCTWGPREVKETKRNVDQRIPARTDLPVNNPAMENSKRSFELLKVVPRSVVADNGAIATTYGLLDTAAVSYMITSQLAKNTEASRYSAQLIKMDPAFQSVVL